MSKIELREITAQNFDECINLKVADSQTEFVATNVLSIAQSKVYPTETPMAIYANDEIVGFTMFGSNEETAKFWLFRLMIDEKYQSQGFGKAATLAVIDKLKQNNDCKELYLCFNPGNEVAEKLYTKIGFARTDETLEDGEIIMKFVIN